MKRFVIEQSVDEFYTTHAGLAFIGPASNRFTTLAAALNAFDAPADTYSGKDIIFSFCALLAEGKNDFVAIEQHRKDNHFRESLGIKAVPSGPTLRQRMDDLASQYRAPVSWASVEFLEKVKATVGHLSTGHVPLDVDGFIMDNSGSSKEQVSCTYQKVDGYLALPAYLGTEGWMINLHLLPGSQHPQKDFTFFIRETLGRVRQFCKKKILLRMDSAHDALDNQFELSRHDQLDWIIKGHPRKQDLAAWAKHVFAEGTVTTPRPGKRIGIVSLKVSDQGAIDLYKGHTTCEQYHAENKTDMDLERLPSGKFATNQLVMACGALAYNILRFMGQSALVHAGGIIRHHAKRRRIKTVMQELIYCAGRLISSGRRLKLRFSCHMQAHANVFAALYRRLAYG